MLKELFITGLLSFTVGSTPLKYVPKHNANGVYQLYGCYCYRDHFDSEILRDVHIDYTFVDYLHTDVQVMVSFDDSYPYTTTLRTFEISYVTDYYHIDMYDGEYNLDEDIHYLDYLYDLNLSSHELVLYFYEPFNVTYDAYNVFNALFTDNGNEWVTNYSGWYTLTSYTTTVNFNVNGFFTCDNNFYNHLAYYSTTLQADLYGYNDSLTIINDRKFVAKSSNILINNTLIADYNRTEMLKCGVFAYVYEPVEYTFGDVIFSVVDAPVYMLSQLFSFELFGLQFYVAFMGIVTIVLICFILKKII